MLNTTAQYYQQALNDIGSLYKRSGFNLTKIWCDEAFHAALGPIVVTYNTPIKVNYANPREHVPQAERNNQYIKENFALYITYYRLTDYHAKWLSTW